MTQTASYEIIRVFDVPREDVFAAWTTPERFARWFGPRFMAAPVDRIVLDARPGGRWQVTLTAEEGFEVTFDGAYRVVAPPARLVFTTGEPDDPVSVLTVGLGLLIRPAAYPHVMRRTWTSIRLNDVSPTRRWTQASRS